MRAKTQPNCGLGPAAVWIDVVLFESEQPTQATSAADFPAGPWNLRQSQVDANNSDPVHFTNTLYGSAPLRMRFQAKTRARRGDYNNRRIVENDPEVADDLLKFR